LRVFFAPEALESQRIKEFALSRSRERHEGRAKGGRGRLPTAHFQHRRHVASLVQADFLMRAKPRQIKDSSLFKAVDEAKILIENVAASEAFQVLFQSMVAVLRRQRLIGS